MKKILLLILVVIIGIGSYFLFSKSNKGNKVNSYYQDNTEAIISIKKVSESDDIQTEIEAKNLLQEKGFEDFPIFVMYSMDGKYVGEEVNEESNNKFPVYYTNYISYENEINWTIYIIENQIVAYPASYRVDNNLSSELMFTEIDTMPCYDNESNSFLLVEPKKEIAIIVKKDAINTDVLDSITKKELDDLWKE